MKLFATDKVNTGRQLELDIARGLAVIFMVLVHVQMMFSKEALVESTIGITVEFFGGIPAAPIFMFLMGIGFLYTRQTDYKYFLKRGVTIWLLGYLLNFLRGFLPELLGYIALDDPEHLNLAIENLIEIDILQFAGLSILFFGFIKWSKINLIGIGMLGLAFALLNYIMLNIQVEGYLLQALTGLFWGSNEHSSFPFLTWIFYPITGYLFATYLIRVANKNSFYKILLLASFLLMMLFILIFVGIFKLDLGMSTETGYYHHDLSANIVYILFCLFWISLLFMITKILPQFIIDQFKRWSKNVTEIYFFHWVLIGWLAVVLYGVEIGLTGFLIISISVYAASDWIAHQLAKRGIGF